MLPASHLRQLHTTVAHLVRTAGRRPTAGVGRQLAALKESPDSHDIPEDFDELESDFMDMHLTHREYQREQQQRRDTVRQLMIKHKYFRDPKLPNMLTYAEKEQMRLLHARDPEEWPAEKLAESFPATPTIVEKLLKAKWRPRSVERIRSHDEQVIRNWETFRNEPEKLELPPDLQEHLRKFATRQRSDIEIPAEQWEIKTELPKPKRTEFLSLITSCKKYADNEKQKSLPTPKGGEAMSIAQSRNFNSQKRPEDETYLLDEVVDKRKMRLHELKEYKLKEKELKAIAAPSVDQQAVETLENPSGTGILPPAALSGTTDYGYVRKYESNEIVVSAEDQRRYEMTKVKDRVHIPRKMWRKGATYRVEDCYYDDDGEFLYRVPGMTGNK